MVMTRDEADRLIASIGAAHDRVATTMYAIDSHATLAYLRAPTHTGMTKQMRDALLFDVDVMWAQFNTVGDILEQARALRAQYRPSDKQWADLARLLAGPVVALDAAGMPVTSDPTGTTGTTGTGRAVGAVRVGDVAVALQTRCLNAMRRLEETARAWNGATAAVADVTNAMATLTALARNVGDEAGVRPLDRRTTALREQVLADPLTYAANGPSTARWRQETADLVADIATATSRLRTESGLRDSYPERIAVLQGYLDALEDEESETAAAFARATDKIAATGLPEAPDAATVLRARIAEFDALHAQQQWRRLADDATTLRIAIVRATERARELRGAADGLIARRDELRGRLEGYRAKAVTYRLDEHDQLGSLHAKARNLLYTAPCDLPAATKAVVAYQTTLAALLGAGPSTGGKEATR
jgi:hypothetical protein